MRGLTANHVMTTEVLAVESDWSIERLSEVLRDTFSMKTFKKKTPSHFQVASYFTSKRLKDAKGVFRSVHRGLVHHARALCKISIYGKSQSWV
jgi:hypothetical protein